jgi:hypothetical protein
MKPRIEMKPSIEMNLPIENESAKSVSSVSSVDKIRVVKSKLWGNPPAVSSIPPHTVAVIGAVCLTVGWLLASTLAPPVARLQSLPERQPKPSTTAQESTFTEQLHLKMHQAPVAPAPRRNPFMFANRARVDAPTPAADTSSTQVTLPPSLPVSLAPVFTLAGIAVDGDVRTAILTDGQDVHLMKVGERLGGYEIVDITDSSVTLAEAPGMRWVLRLR